MQELPTGICRFGDICRYDHSKEGGNETNFSQIMTLLSEMNGKINNLERKVEKN